MAEHRRQGPGGGGGGSQPTLQVRGPPEGSPFSVFPRSLLAFFLIRIVKRPPNQTKQDPLPPYQKEFRNGPRIASIRHQCFEKSPKNLRKLGPEGKRRKTWA